MERGIKKGYSAMCTIWSALNAHAPGKQCVPLKHSPCVGPPPPHTTASQNLPIDGPVDNFLAKLIHRGDIQAYLPDPPLAWQVGNDSDIEHTHTDEKYVPCMCDC